MVAKTGSVKKSSNQPTHFKKKTLILYIHTYSWRYILDIPRLYFANYITKKVLFFSPEKLTYLRLFLFCVTSISQTLMMGQNPMLVDPAKILQQQKTLPGPQQLAVEGSEETRIWPPWARRERTWPNSGFEVLVAQLAPCNKVSAQRGLTTTISALKGICGSFGRRTNTG